jgi:hypothetical protein
VRNIDIFKAASAVALADLYAAFPLPTSLVPSDIALRLQDDLWDQATRPDPEHPNAEIYQRQYSPASLAAPTIEWLASAGLLTYVRKQNGKFEGAVLTAKGLESIEAKAGQGESLVHAAKSLAVESAKQAAKDQLKNVFSEVLRWCIEKSPTLIHTAIQHVGS